MYAIIRAVALASIVMLASGCSVFAAFQDRIGSAIGRYCEEPETAREAMREYINSAAAPNSVYIACEGDTPPDDEPTTPAP